MFLFYLYGISLISYFGSVPGLVSRQLTARVVEEFEGKTLSKFSRKIIYDMSLVYCHMQCLEDEECMSFFYHHGNKTCQTHGVVFFNPDDGDFSPGTKYCRTTHDSCSSCLGYVYNRAFKFCYKPHFTAKMTYHFARHVCQNEGGDLITIDTKEQLDHLGQIIIGSTFPSVFRLGAHGGVSVNDWQWIDGKNITQDLWCPGYPAMRGGLRQSAIIVIGALIGSACLAEIWEEEEQYFFCELKV